MDAPEGVAVERHLGDLYIADTGNNRLRGVRGDPLERSGEPPMTAGDIYTVGHLRNWADHRR